MGARETREDEEWVIEGKVGQNGLWESRVIVPRHVDLRLGVEWDLKIKQEQLEDCGNKNGSWVHHT